MSDFIHIVCPHCDAVNRISRQRSALDGQCGRCHQRLFIQEPVELTAARFEKHLTRSDIPLVIDFWAPWCGPCQMMAPQFVQVAAQLEPQVRCIKINTDVNQDIGHRFAIRSIPTILLMKQQREIARSAGAMQAQDLIRWLQTNL
jgi:thioredoxin 2